MKTLNQIRDITDLDARVINASALLEFELRHAIALSRDNTLGRLVQKFEPFKANGFVRQVKFALRVRNAIAHSAWSVDPTQTEKTRAADYLIRAVQIVQLKNGTPESAQRPESAPSPKPTPRPASARRPKSAPTPGSAPRPESAASSRLNIVVSSLNVIVFIVLALVIPYWFGLYQTVEDLLQRTQNATPANDTLIHSEQTPIIRPAKRKSDIRPPVRTTAAPPLRDPIGKSVALQQGF